MIAYKNGQINQALSVLRCAADMGNIGANWELGHIYAEGNGVFEDDYKAYNFLHILLKKVLILAPRIKAMFMMHWLNLRVI